MRQDGICEHKFKHHVVLGEVTDSGAGEGNIQGEPGERQVSESKEILERKSTMMGACQRDIGAK